MKRLILHIGYPKTATTSLQQNLFYRFMLDGKLEYLNHLNRPDEKLGDIYCGDIISFITGAKSLHYCRKEISFLTRITNEISIISNENISFFCTNFRWGFHNGDAVYNAKRIRDVFSNHFDEIEILLGIRRQAEIIPSFYVQCFNSISSECTRFIDFKNWLEEIFFDPSRKENLMFNYYQMLSSYIDIFGKRRIHIYVYEDIASNSNDFYTIMSNLFKTSKEEIISYMHGNVLNQRNRSSSNSFLVKKATVHQKIIGPYRRLARRICTDKAYNFLRIGYRRFMPNKLSQLQIGKERLVDGIDRHDIDKIMSLYGSYNEKFVKLSGLSYEKLKNYKYY